MSMLLASPSPCNCLFHINKTLTQILNIHFEMYFSHFFISNASIAMIQGIKIVLK